MVVAHFSVPSGASVFRPDGCIIFLMDGLTERFMLHPLSARSLLGVLKGRERPLFHDSLTELLHYQCDGFLDEYLAMGLRSCDICLLPTSSWEK